MGEPKKFKITIKQVKIDYHEMTLECDDLMVALDQARERVAKRNEQSKDTGNVYSVTKIEEVKDE